jgi:hypothetical protein
LLLITRFVLEGEETINMGRTAGPQSRRQMRDAMVYGPSRKEEIIWGWGVSFEWARWDGIRLTGVKVACARSGRDRGKPPMRRRDVRSTCIRLNTVSPLVTLESGNSGSTSGSSLAMVLVVAAMAT